MAMSYRTKDGDMVDQIAWEYYGRQDGLIVEQVLEANPGLADKGPVLEAGIRVILPDVETPSETDGVRLWT